MGRREEKAKAAIAKAKSQGRPEPTARQARSDARYEARKAQSQAEIAAAEKKAGGGK